MAITPRAAPILNSPRGSPTHERRNSDDIVYRAKVVAEELERAKETEDVVERAKATANVLRVEFSKRRDEQGQRQNLKQQLMASREQTQKEKRRREELEEELQRVMREGGKLLTEKDNQVRVAVEELTKERETAKAIQLQHENERSDEARLMEEVMEKRLREVTDQSAKDQEAIKGHEAIASELRTRLDGEITRFKSEREEERQRMTVDHEKELQRLRDEAIKEEEVRATAAKETALLKHQLHEMEKTVKLKENEALRTMQAIAKERGVAVEQFAQSNEVMERKLRESADQSARDREAISAQEAIAEDLRRRLVELESMLSRVKLEILDERQGMAIELGRTMEKMRDEATIREQQALNVVRATAADEVSTLMRQLKEMEKMVKLKETEAKSAVEELARERDIVKSAIDHERDVAKSIKEMERRVCLAAEQSARERDEAIKARDARAAELANSLVALTNKKDREMGVLKAESQSERQRMARDHQAVIERITAEMNMQRSASNEFKAKTMSDMATMEQTIKHLNATSNELVKSNDVDQADLSRERTAKERAVNELVAEIDGMRRDHETTVQRMRAVMEQDKSAAAMLRTEAAKMVQEMDVRLLQVAEQSARDVNRYQVAVKAHEAIAMELRTRLDSEITRLESEREEERQRVTVDHEKALQRLRDDVDSAQRVVNEVRATAANEASPLKIQLHEMELTVKRKENEALSTMQAMAKERSAAVEQFAQSNEVMERKLREASVQSARDREAISAQEAITEELRRRLVELESTMRRFKSEREVMEVEHDKSIQKLSEDVVMAGQQAADVARATAVKVSALTRQLKEMETMVQFKENEAQSAIEELAREREIVKSAIDHQNDVAKTIKEMERRVVHATGQHRKSLDEAIRVRDSRVEELGKNLVMTMNQKDHEMIVLKSASESERQRMTDDHQAAIERITAEINLERSTSSEIKVKMTSEMGTLEETIIRIKAASAEQFEVMRLAHAEEKARIIAELELERANMKRDHEVMLQLMGREMDLEREAADVRSHKATMEIETRLVHDVDQMERDRSVFEAAIKERRVILNELRMRVEETDQAIIQMRSEREDERRRWMNSHEEVIQTMKDEVNKESRAVEVIRVNAEDQVAAMTVTITEMEIEFKRMSVEKEREQKEALDDLTRELDAINNIRDQREKERLDEAVATVNVLQMQLRESTEKASQDHEAFEAAIRARETICDTLTRRLAAVEDIKVRLERKLIEEREESKSELARKTDELRRRETEHENSILEIEAEMKKVKDVRGQEKADALRQLAEMEQTIRRNKSAFIEQLESSQEALRASVRGASSIDITQLNTERQRLNLEHQIALKELQEELKEAKDVAEQDKANGINERVKLEEIIKQNRFSFLHEFGSKEGDMNVAKTEIAQLKEERQQILTDHHNAVEELQAELKQLKDAAAEEKAKAIYELQNMQVLINQNQVAFTEQLEAMRHEATTNRLDKLNDEIAQLKAERQRITTDHHNAVEELHDELKRVKDTAAQDEAMGMEQVAKMSEIIKRYKVAFTEQLESKRSETSGTVYNELTNEIAQLKVERQQMITDHHNVVKELREEMKQVMHAANHDTTKGVDLVGKIEANDIGSNIRDESMKEIAQLKLERQRLERDHVKELNKEMKRVKDAAEQNQAKIDKTIKQNTIDVTEQLEAKQHATSARLTFDLKNEIAQLKEERQRMTSDHDSAIGQLHEEIQRLMDTNVHDNTKKMEQMIMAEETTTGAHIRDKLINEIALLKEERQRRTTDHQSAIEELREQMKRMKDAAAQDMAKGAIQVAEMEDIINRNTSALSEQFQSKQDEKSAIMRDEFNNEIAQFKEERQRMLTDHHKAIEELHTELNRVKDVASDEKANAVAQLTKMAEIIKRNKVLTEQEETRREDTNANIRDELKMEIIQLKEERWMLSNGQQEMRDEMKKGHGVVALEKGKIISQMAQMDVPVFAFHEQLESRDALPRKCHDDAADRSALMFQLADESRRNANTLYGRQDAVMKGKDVAERVDEAQMAEMEKRMKQMEIACNQQLELKEAALRKARDDLTEERSANDELRGDLKRARRDLRDEMEQREAEKVDTVKVKGRCEKFVLPFDGPSELSKSDAVATEETHSIPPRGSDLVRLLQNLARERSSVQQHVPEPTLTRWGRDQAHDVPQDEWMRRENEPRDQVVARCEVKKWTRPGLSDDAEHEKPRPFCWPTERQIENKFEGNSTYSDRQQGATLKPRLMTVEAQQILCRWIGEALHSVNAPVSLAQLFQASADDFSATRFHQDCDDRGPTIFIACTDTGHIFGGFNSNPWSSSSTVLYRSSTSNFLFELPSHPRPGNPVKYPIDRARAKFAAYNTPMNGPCFGRRELIINDKTHTCPSTMSLVCSTYPDAGDIAGSDQFLIVEYEVYRATFGYN